MIYNKEKPDFKFSYLKDYDISRMKEIVQELEKEWLLDTSRQELFDVHKYTESYIINKVSIFGWEEHSPLSHISTAETTELSSLALEIARDLEKELDGTMGQVLFIKLEAGKAIGEHEDDGSYLYRAARHHIPIITNPGVNFIIDGESKHVPEGECWEINNNKLHAVENNGKEDRIHLLIDIVPNKYIKAAL
jgi:quercetin dioxygenase-like cupin family protein